MGIPEKMYGVVLTGHGGLDCLEWREDLAVPIPGDGEVLVRVLASSVNNTDINTRTAWYSKSVRGATAAAARSGSAGTDYADGGWSGKPLSFPRIQGADCCGEIVGVGRGVPADRIGQRVLMRALQSTGADEGRFSTWTFGSECDGAFAQFTKTFSVDALPVRSDWSDTELASIPCAYSTAEGMLQRIGLKDENVLITGASGGVGSAAIQLAKRRGAHVTAVAGAGKADEILPLGADETIGRVDPIPEPAYDAVIDLVAGPRRPDMIAGLRRGGQYVTAGAIAGPIVELDVRSLYLRDLTLFGSTYQYDNVLPDVIGYIERDELKPVIAREFPIKEIRAAQEAFLKKTHIGKIVIRVAEV